MSNLDRFLIELQLAHKNNRLTPGGLRVVSLREQVYIKGGHDPKHLVSKGDPAATGEK